MSIYACSFFGWTAIFLMFFYFFALVLVLFEIHGFHLTIERYASDDRLRTREVLLAVRDAFGDADKSAGVEDFNEPNYGQIALRLDELRQSLAALSKLEPESLELKQRSEVVSTSDTPFEKIEPTGSQLRELLKDHYPDLPLMLELENFQTVFNDLRKVTIESPQSLKSARSDDGKGLPDKGEANSPGSSAETNLTKVQGNIALFPGYLSTDARAKVEDVREGGLSEEILSARDTLEQAKENIGRRFEQLQGFLETRVGNELVAEQVKELELAIEGLESLRIMRGATYRYSSAERASPDKDDLAVDTDELQSRYRTNIDNASIAVLAIVDRLNADVPQSSSSMRLASALHTIETVGAGLKRLQIGDAIDSQQSEFEATTFLETARTKLENGLEEIEQILDGRAPQLEVARALHWHESPQAAARALWSDYSALDRYQRMLKPLHSVSQANILWGLPAILDPYVGFQPRDLAIWSEQSLTLMLVFVMGAIGSLIYITKFQLGLMIQGVEKERQLPLRWFVFRPIFGIVVAFAVYLLYRSGQLALGTGGTDITSDGANIWVLSVLSLFAGLLSWQALQMIESRGSNWIGSFTRRPLWATGLDNALHKRDRTITECAERIGRSDAQIERWIGLADQVTPEMQDRISTWLDSPLSELFGETKPIEAPGNKALWATGLKAVLAEERHRLDAGGLAELLGERRHRVEDWIELRSKVSPAMQWRLVEKLDARHSELFDLKDTEDRYWATGLRHALERWGTTGAASKVETLAERIGSSPHLVRAWMELERPVPLILRNEISRQVGTQESLLFESTLPEPDEFGWATRLREALVAHSMRAPDLAKQLDLDTSRINRWMELDALPANAGPAGASGGLVCPASQDRIVALLGAKRRADVFDSARPADRAFKYMMRELIAMIETMPEAERIQKLDAEPERIAAWLAGTSPVAPGTMEWIAGLMKRPVSELFTPEPPGGNRPG